LLHCAEEAHKFEIIDQWQKINRFRTTGTRTSIQFTRTLLLSMARTAPKRGIGPSGPKTKSSVSFIEPPPFGQQEQPVFRCPPNRL
jgi:hypothetical protein